MKYRFIHKKNFHTILLISVIGFSVGFTLYDWSSLHELTNHLKSVRWMGIGLLVTEAFFVLGALLMAFSAGEIFVDIRRLHHLPKHLAQARKNARVFAEQLLKNRLFSVGFWLNFAGAIGTSVILIVGVLVVAPVTGAGVLFAIVADLFATFGWRIPLAIARRKANHNVQYQNTASNQSRYKTV